MYLCFDQHRRATNPIQLDLRMRVCRRVVHLRHQAAVRSHLAVPLQQDIVFAHLVSHFLCRRAVDPIVEVVLADCRGFGVLVVVALEAVGHDDGDVVVGQVLDEGRGRLDNVGVEPQDPRCGRAHGGEEEGVACLGHGGPARLLVLHFVPLFFELGLEGGLGVLAQDGDGGKALGFGAGLRLCDLGLERGVGCVAFFCLGYYEAEGYQPMGVAELCEVVPVFLVELRHWRQDQHGLLILNGCPRGGEVVHVVVYDGRRCLRCVRFRLSEGQRWRRERIRGRLPCAAVLANDGGVIAGEEEDEEAYAQDGCEHDGDGIRAPEGARHGDGRVRKEANRGCQKWIVL